MLPGALGLLRLSSDRTQQYIPYLTFYVVVVTLLVVFPTLLKEILTSTYRIEDRYPISNIYY